MKREEKSTLGFMILTGSPMPMFLVAAMVNVSLMIRLIMVLLPIIIGFCIMIGNTMERKV